MKGSQYELLDGHTVDLGGLTVHETKFLEHLKELIRDGITYVELVGVAVGPGSTALQGHSQINATILDSPLYLATRDIVTRAGIAQGLILPEDVAAAEGARPTAPATAAKPAASVEREPRRSAVRAARTPKAPARGKHPAHA